MCLWSVQAAVTSAAVVYETDFSNDPEWITDGSGNFEWDEQLGVYRAVFTNGPQTNPPNRFAGIETALDPTRSFTLTWRERIASSTGDYYVAPFGLVSSGLVAGSTTAPLYDGGLAQFYYGIHSGRFFWAGFDIRDVGGTNAGSEGITSVIPDMRAWYSNTLSYDVNTGIVTFVMMDENTGVETHTRAAGTAQNRIVFGSGMRHVGMSYHPYTTSNSFLSFKPGAVEVLIDDVRLEDDTVVPQDTSVSDAHVSPSVAPVETAFTFTAVYTDSEGEAPTRSEVIVGSTTYELAPDANATSSEYSDGEYENGEQYIATTTLTDRGNWSVTFVFENSATTTYAYTNVGVGNSSVVFLPGIKSTYLYRPGIVEDNQLWLPNIIFGTDDDVLDLRMNEQGESVNDDIYTKPGDIIDSAYLRYPIYDGYIEQMDDLVADGTIASWEAVAYDWRLDPRDVVTHGEESDGKISYALDGDYITEQLRTLADQSDTGRVSIVAHSNGGLVAKALLQHLEETNDPLLSQVDLLVLVAVPQLGTPKVLLPLLHGAENELEKILLSDAAMRAAAKNMPGGMTLIPSKHYFERASEFGPVIVFDQSLDILATTTRYRDEFGYFGLGINAVRDYRTTYGDNIDSYDEMRDFLIGEDGRPEPEYLDIAHPVRIPTPLVDAAQEFHDSVDDWEPPMRTVQIVGTGRDTVAGVRYITANHLEACLPPLCTGSIDLPQVQATPVGSMEGDGTVMAVSADALNVETYYFDLSKYNAEREVVGDVTNREHSNIMGAFPMQTVLGSLIIGTPVVSPYITETSTDSKDKLTVEIHSPVLLTVNDSFGNSAGLAYDFVIGTTTPTSTIPNAVMYHIGESAFFTLPADRSYTLSLDGLASSTFTMRIARYEQDELIGTTTFTNVPVTASLIGTMNIPTGTTSAPLQLDVNGDGTVDTMRMPDGTKVVTPLSLMKDFTTALEPMKVGKPLKTSLRILATTTTKLITEKKYPAAKAIALNMRSVIELGVPLKQISRKDANALIAILNLVIPLLK